MRVLRVLLSQSLRVPGAALNVIPAGKWGTMLLFAVQKVENSGDCPGGARIRRRVPRDTDNRQEELLADSSSCEQTVQVQAGHRSRGDRPGAGRTSSSKNDTREDNKTSDRTWGNWVVSAGKS